jgi:SAM-dependent methyltransferase
MEDDPVAIYNAIAQQYAAEFDTEVSDKEFLDSFISKVAEDGKVLDVGCGTGQHANYLNQQGLSVRGVDLSREMIAIAQTNYPHIPFTQTDIRHLHFPEQSFDAIWAAYSLFHLKSDDFIKVVSDMRILLKPSGILGLVMQEGKGEVEIDEPFLPGAKMYVHLYTLDQLQEILKDNGFSVLSSEAREPKSEKELPYRKLFLLAGLTQQ